MNTDYVKQLILKSFNYLVQDVLAHNFVYDNEEIKKGVVEVYTDDLDTTLHSLGINIVDLRTLIEEFEQFYGINMIEEKYWVDGKNTCLISRKDDFYDPYLGMITLIDAGVRLLPELTFRDLFNDVYDLVVQKLQSNAISIN